MKKSKKRDAQKVVIGQNSATVHRQSLASHHLGLFRPMRQRLARAAFRRGNVPDGMERTVQPVASLRRGQFCVVQHGVQCQQRVERELQWQLQQQQQDEPGRGHSRPGDDMPLVALKTNSAMPTFCKPIWIAENASAARALPLPLRSTRSAISCAFWMRSIRGIRYWKNPRIPRLPAKTERNLGRFVPRQSCPPFDLQ